MDEYEAVEDFTRLKSELLFKKSQKNADLFGVEEGEKKKFLITLDTCGHCKDYKERIKDKLESGEICEFPCSEDSTKEEEYKNLKIIAENDIGMQKEGIAFPTVVEVEKKGEVLQVCEIDRRTGDKDKCHVLKDTKDQN